MLSITDAAAALLGEFGNVDTLSLDTEAELATALAFQTEAWRLADIIDAAERHATHGSIMAEYRRMVAA